MGIFTSIQELLSRTTESKLKVTPGQRRELEKTIKQFMESKGIKSPSTLMIALKKDGGLRSEFASIVGKKAVELNIVGDEKRGFYVGLGVLRGMVAEERRNLKLLNLVGGNEMFLKSADAARTLFAEVKAEVGENNTFKFLVKYYTDKGFHNRVNALVGEKLKDERFSMFAGLKPEEVIKGTSAVHILTMSRSEKARELAPIATRESLKSIALSLGTATASMVEQMTYMVTSVVIGQVPGGAQSLSLVHSVAKGSGSIFESMYNVMKKLQTAKPDQVNTATVEQLVRDMVKTG